MHLFWLLATHRQLMIRPRALQWAGIWHCAWWLSQCRKTGQESSATNG